MLIKPEAERSEHHRMAGAAIAMQPCGMPGRAPQNNAVTLAAHRWSVRFGVLS